MSHFSVLVIGPDWEDQLAPYHEYECTGRDDQYVVDVDVTGEVIAEFNKPLPVVVLANGSVFGRYDNRFYVEQPSTVLPRMREHVFVLPGGAHETTMDAATARGHGVGYATVDECAEESGGYIKRDDGRYYNRTNPNAKWDWYIMGGRFTGHFLQKSGAIGAVGKRGVFGTPPREEYVDRIRKGDVDFQRQRDAAETEARDLWTACRAVTGGASWLSWDVCHTQETNVENARALYNQQSAIVALRACGDERFRAWNINDDLALDLESYIKLCRDKAFTTYAFVRDSVWTERGTMGWFGMSSDEMDYAEWRSKFNTMLDELPDDTMLTVVDCHI